MSASDPIASPPPARSATPRGRLPRGPRALAASWVGSRLPRRTVRLRLTLMYGALFLVSGAALLATTYLLVKGSGSEEVTFSKGGVQGSIVGKVPGISPGGAQIFQVHVQTHRSTAPGAVMHASESTRTSGHASESAHAGGHASESAHAVPVPESAGVPVHAPEGVRTSGPVSVTPQQVQYQVRQLHTLATQQHSAELHQLLIMSGIALAIMAVASMGLGWLIAGRALRPLHKITSAAREISASNLHERLALDGPDDELTELGDTFDGLLSRLESSFQSQRQFVANASHELRTPLTVERALLEVALADPDADYDSLRATCERVLASSEEQERLIEALLTLASGERGLERREHLDLGALTSEALLAREGEIERRGLSLSPAIDPAPTVGDVRLLERLVANLLDNALRHNVAGGRVEVTTAGRAGVAVLSVSNSGPRVPPAEIERLFQPFQRLTPDRAAHGNGHGLGLSIVRAIADTHGATLVAHSREGGGLVVEVRVPSASALVKLN
ncbi:MAG TPA: HAMP domain-containing sensor histidine kinase [Solirubrobacteraceae bacterium]|nr:HAMP domain-containing sensor histidine kinase [Solirubrobacteraceae bacterium]